MAWMAVENQGGFASGVLLVATLASLLPLALTFIFKNGTRKRRVDLDSLQRSDVHAKIPKEGCLNTRYFAAAQVGSCLVLPFCLVIPLTGEETMNSYYSILVLLLLSLVSSVSLIYLNRKGDLRWLDEVDEP